jgi:hypothetical protein
VKRQAIIAAAVAQRPGFGGHTWMALQWLLGFRALGWDALLVDRLEPNMCRDGSGAPCAVERSANLAYLSAVMASIGLPDAWAVVVPGARSLGVPRRELERRVGASDVFLNVMGYLDADALAAHAPLRVFLDIDPGFAQMWYALGLHDAFAGHDRFVSVGSRVGTSGCDVPDCGLPWIGTLPPVVLEQWPVRPGGANFSTVASWRGPFGPIPYEGRTYGLRVHEFRKFLALPEMTGQTFALALEIDPTDAEDLARLRGNGWTLVDPRAAAGDPVAYREFIQRSGGELNVAKNLYVDTRGGWFSDRSACYLASGKPVLAQDTGFRDVLPADEGLLAFSTLGEAAAGVEEIAAHRARHARVAREIAEEHLASERVLGRLLAAFGVD